MMVVNFCLCEAVKSHRAQADHSSSLIPLEHRRTEVFEFIQPTAVTAGFKQSGGVLQVDNQQQAKAQVPAEQSRKHVPCQILKSGKACTLGAKCPFAHGEHERRLALEALQVRSDQPEPPVDAPSLQQARSDVNAAEIANRARSNGSSSPDTLVSLMLKTHELAIQDM